jgi:hypothetical protein
MEFMPVKRENASAGFRPRDAAEMMAFQEPPSRRGIASNTFRASARLPQAARDSMARLNRKIGIDEHEVEGEDDEEETRWEATRRAAARERREVARRRSEA